MSAPAIMAYSNVFGCFLWCDSSGLIVYARALLHVCRLTFKLDSRGMFASLVTEFHSFRWQSCSSLSTFFLIFCFLSFCHAILQILTMAAGRSTRASKRAAGEAAPEYDDVTINRRKKKPKPSRGKEKKSSNTLKETVANGMANPPKMADKMVTNAGKSVTPEDTSVAKVNETVATKDIELAPMDEDGGAMAKTSTAVVAKTAGAMEKETPPMKEQTAEKGAAQPTLTEDQAGVLAKQTTPMEEETAKKEAAELAPMEEQTGALDKETTPMEEEKAKKEVAEMAPMKEQSGALEKETTPTEEKAAPMEEDPTATKQSLTNPVLPTPQASTLSPGSSSKSGKDGSKKPGYPTNSMLDDTKSASKEKETVTKPPAPTEMVTKPPAPTVSPGSSEMAPNQPTMSPSRQVLQPIPPWMIPSPPPRRRKR